MVADLKILLQFQSVDQCAAIRAFHPKAFRHVFTAVKAAESGFVKDAHEVVESMQ